MVFFTCNHCGESVKKPSVEKHYNTKCRGQDINVSCMDCQKDFHGKEHVAHTKCISEAEKYSAKGFVPKSEKNTNAKKQDSWTNVVHSILESSEYVLKPRTREAFQRLQNYENVPRKQVKFENFAIKCLRMHKIVANEMWSILEKELKKLNEARKREMEAKKLAQSESNKSNENKLKDDNGHIEEIVKKRKTNEEDSEKPAKKKKRKNRNLENQNTVILEEPAKKKKKQKENGITDENKVNSTNEEEDEEKCINEPSKKKKNIILTETQIDNQVTNGHTDTEDNSDNFKWLDMLQKTVKKSGESGITMKNLEKKLLKKYKSKLGLKELNEKQEKKFAKKIQKHLKKCSNITVQNDIAKII